jgi:hypothetical protein
MNAHVTLDQLPGFRRRFLIESAPGVARAELEDDFHCMGVAVHHCDGVAVRVEPLMRRAPWSTCPGAVEQLKSTFDGVALRAFATRGEKRANCTHLHDLATLAAAHAFDPTPLLYDILVSDPSDGQRAAELRRNGEPVLRWTLIGTEFKAPAVLAGLRLDQLNPWIATLAPQQQEEARLLRWGTMIAHGRMISLSQQSDARRMPAANCYTFQPQRAPHAARVGEIRDFSAGGPAPLDAHLNSPLLAARPKGSAANSV